MKYIFCIIAVVLTLATWIYVFSIKDKNKAMLKVLYVASSVIYLVAQFFVFIKIGRRSWGFLDKYSYLVQVICLFAYILVILISTLVDKYIMSIQRKEERSISTFVQIRQGIEESIVLAKHDEVKNRLMKLSDSVRYMNPVCHGAEKEEAEILQLIQNLKQYSFNEEALCQICDDIEQLLKMREIHNRN